LLEKAAATYSTGTRKLVIFASSYDILLLLAESYANCLKIQPHNVSLNAALSEWKQEENRGRSAYG